MLVAWEDTFKTWSQGPATTEQTKCENTEKVIRDALNNDSKLGDMDTRVFIQGSYRARTNIRQNSDVDICVLLRNQVFADYGHDITQKTAGLVDSDFTFSQFKDLVGHALINRFGEASVVRGGKAFDVHENSYRVDADVVPAFEHRRYFKNASGQISYSEGIAFKTDSGIIIKNWPEHTYDNGVAKNDQTSRRYKRVIRILKRLRDHMQGNKVSAATNVASFLIESLVWNAPNGAFSSDYYTDNVRAVLVHTFNHTMTQEKCNEWGEVNELKYLFRDDTQPWTRQGAHNFLSAAWDFVGYK